MSRYSQNEYTNAERDQIARYIIKHKYYSKLRGNTIWKEMEEKHVVRRSWQSMKNHFQKKMIHNLNSLSISVEERNKLKTSYNASSRKMLIPNEGKHVVRPVRKKFWIFSDDDDSSTENIQTAKETPEGNTQGSKSPQGIDKEVVPSSSQQQSTKTPLTSQNYIDFSSSDESLDLLQGLCQKADASVQISTDNQDDFTDALPPDYLIFKVNSEDHVFLPFSKMHLKEMLKDQLNVNSSHIHVASEEEFLKLQKIKQIKTHVNNHFKKILTNHLEHGVRLAENNEREALIEIVNLIHQNFSPADFENITDDESGKCAGADETRKISADKNKSCGNMDEAVETDFDGSSSGAERIQNDWWTEMRKINKILVNDNATDTNVDKISANMAENEDVGMNESEDNTELGQRKICTKENESQAEMGKIAKVFVSKNVKSTNLDKRSVNMDEIEDVEMSESEDNADLNQRTKLNKKPAEMENKNIFVGKIQSGTIVDKSHKIYVDSSESENMEESEDDAGLIQNKIKTNDGEEAKNRNMQGVNITTIRKICMDDYRRSESMDENENVDSDESHLTQIKTNSEENENLNRKTNLDENKKVYKDKKEKGSMMDEGRNEEASSVNETVIVIEDDEEEEECNTSMFLPSSDLSERSNLSGLITQLEIQKENLAQNTSLEFPNSSDTFHSACSQHFFSLE